MLRISIKTSIFLFAALLSSALLLSGCNQPSTPKQTYPTLSFPTQAPRVNSAPSPKLGPSPTPDQPRVLPTLRANSIDYWIDPGDTLNRIAAQYGVALKSVIDANQIDDPDLIEPGQHIIIPPPVPGPNGPGFKIIPNSELVDSPSAAAFDLDGFIQQQGGYLSHYSEDVAGETMTASQIIRRIGLEYSIHPRLLLALLENQSAWVTNPSPDPSLDNYPMGLINAGYKGLYMQLAYTANNLNRGYYLWKINSIAGWVFPDGVVYPPAVTINAGTAGVQYLLSRLYEADQWQSEVGEEGFFQTYVRLFGDPFAYAIEPLIPPDLTQPPMQLPFLAGDMWYFTGGPHGGWGDGSAWSAIDFGPPGEPTGCLPNDAWEAAVAGGEVVYSDNGTIVQDIDGDGVWQTGWSVLYLHVATLDRVAEGTLLEAGDRIGHPSCEGGVSYAAHLHLARRYNGEWIPADGKAPFNLDGWISEGEGVEYNGYLRQNDRVVEAWDHPVPENEIQR